jgi:hypothetical protein
MLAQELPPIRAGLLGAGLKLVEGGDESLGGGVERLRRPHAARSALIGRRERRAASGVRAGEPAPWLLRSACS